MDFSAVQQIFGFSQYAVAITGLIFGFENPLISDPFLPHLALMIPFQVKQTLLRYIQIGLKVLSLSFSTYVTLLLLLTFVSLKLLTFFRSRFSGRSS